MTPRLAPDAAATGQIFWYTVEGQGVRPRPAAGDPGLVRPPAARRVPGVAEVASVGGLPLEYQVDLDPDRLRAHGDRARAGRRGGPQGERGGRRERRPQGERRVPRPRRRLARRTAGRAGRRVRAAAGHPRPGERRPRCRRRHAGPARRTWRSVSLGSAAARGVLEKDGNEASGGVVLMRHGENPLEVTRRLRAKIQELQAGPAARRADRAVLRPHAADRGGHRHGHAHARRSDAHRDGLRRARPAPRPHGVRRRPHAAARGPVLVRPGRCAPRAPGSRRRDEHHVAGRDRHLDRRAGRLVDRDGRERHAPAEAAVRRRAGPRRHARGACWPPAARSAGRSSSRC